MKVILKFFRCNQKARFFVLFLIFCLSFLLNLDHWVTLQEIVIASSFIPFFGYLALTIGHPWLIALYYGFKEGETNAKLTSIAKKENNRIRKVVVKDIKRAYAYANRFTNSIILTRKLLDTLSDEETEAVLYHEIAHGGFYPLFTRVLMVVLLIPLFLVLYVAPCMTVYSVINFLHPFLDTFFLSLVSSFLFCMFFFFVERKIHWASEYKADTKAAEKAGIETVISALRKALPREFWNCDSPTHPSLKRRIAHLKKKRDARARKN